MNRSTDKESAYPLNPVHKAFNRYLESFRNKIYNGYTLSKEILYPLLLKCFYSNVLQDRHIVI